MRHETKGPTSDAYNDSSDPTVKMRSLHIHKKQWFMQTRMTKIESLVQSQLSIRASLADHDKPARLC